MALRGELLAHGHCRLVERRLHVSELVGEGNGDIVPPPGVHQWSAGRGGSLQVVDRGERRIADIDCLEAGLCRVTRVCDYHRHTLANVAHHV